MKAKVIRCFTINIKDFREGEILDIYNDKVFRNNGKWICDIDSPFFNKHFALVKK